MVIAFSGLDGAGKTTQAKKLISFLEEKGHSSAYIHWLSGYPHWLSSAKSQSPKEASSKSYEPSFFKIIARMILLLFNFCFLTIRIGWNRLLKRKVVLDRCFIDEVVHLRYKGLSERAFLLLLRDFLIPRKTFYLRLDPETAAARKRGEHDLNYYKEKIKIYEKAFQQLEDVKVIEAANPEETFKEVVKNIQ